MKVIYALAAYAIAMIAANLSVATLGPVVPLLMFNAFALIGLDLALRDWLHFRLSRTWMLCLIAGTGLLTYALNPAARDVCLASSVSFGISTLVDWLVFANSQGSWAKRSMKSNVAGALVDSLLFPTMAFGAILPAAVAAQFVAKVLGSAVWTVVLSKLRPSGVTGRATFVNAVKAQ